MEFKKNLDSKSSIRLKKIFYPITSSVLTLLIAACFIFTASFISQNLNKIFYDGVSVLDPTSIDQDQLQLIAQKLGIKIQLSQPTVESDQINIINLPEEKTDLQINILNDGNN